MLLNGRRRDYPRGYRVDLSIDGREWHTVAEDREARVPILEFLDPNDLRFEISFPIARARYIRIVQTGRNPLRLWSIHELDVRRPRSAGPG